MTPLLVLASLLPVGLVTLALMYFSRKQLPARCLCLGGWAVALAFAAGLFVFAGETYPEASEGLAAGSAVAVIVNLTAGVVSLVFSPDGC